MTAPGRARLRGRESGAFGSYTWAWWIEYGRLRESLRFPREIVKRAVWMDPN